MTRRRCLTQALAWVLGCLCLGCSTPNLNVRVVRTPEGVLRVDAPWAGPYETMEELAEDGCEKVTSQPGASHGDANGEYGMEYCALHYYSPEDQAYYLSFLSNVGGNGPDGMKFCVVPRAINELNRKSYILLGPAHNHPHNREFSRPDTGKGRPLGWSPLGTSRVFDRETQRVWDRELLVFYRERDGRCSTFKYNYFTRLVYALRDGAWVSIGKAEGQYGRVTLFDGQEWLP